MISTNLDFPGSVQCLELIVALRYDIIYEDVMDINNYGISRCYFARIYCVIMTRLDTTSVDRLEDQRLNRGS